MFGKEKQKGVKSVLELKEELLKEGLENFKGRIGNNVDVDNMCKAVGPSRETVFHLLVEDENVPDSYKVEIGKHLHILKKTNIYGNTVGHRIAECGGKEAVDEMLKVLEHTENKEVRDLRGQINDRGQTIFYIIDRRKAIEDALRTDKDK